MTIKENWEERFAYLLGQLLLQQNWIVEAKKEEEIRMRGPEKKEYNIGGFWSGYKLIDTFANRPDTLAQYQQRQDKLQMHYDGLINFISTLLEQQKNSLLSELIEEIVDTVTTDITGVEFIGDGRKKWEVLPNRGVEPCIECSNGTNIEKLLKLLKSKQQ